MPASSNPTKTKHYLLVTLWLLFTFVAAGYFIQLRLVEFDPDQQLYGLSRQEVQLELEQLLALTSGDSQGKIIHFSSENCRCNKLAQRHKSSINRLASADGLGIVDYEIASLPDNFPLPSVPAIALFDKQGELAYLGPYSQGLGCGESEGMIEVVMNNLRHGMNPELILNDAKGCYCNV